MFRSRVSTESGDVDGTSAVGCVGKRRLKRQIQHDLEQMRPRFVSASIGSGLVVTEEARDGWGRVMSAGGLNGES